MNRNAPPGTGPTGRATGQSNGLARPSACQMGAKQNCAALTNGLPSRTNVCTWRKRTCASQGGSPGLDPKLTLGRDNSTDSLSIKYKSPDDAGLEFLEST